MDIFRFINPTHPLLLDRGQLINGIKTKLWIERYRDASEFELVANISKNVHSMLPIGSLISHSETSEVMIVENHEISEERGTEPEIKMSGRSFESYLENRVVGTNKVWPTEASANEEYVLSSGYTWNQAVVMIRDHIDPAVVIDIDNSLPHIETYTDVSGTGEVYERVIKRGPLYTRLMELLAIDNLGIKVIRPGVRSPLGWESNKMAMVIHKGEDLSGDIVFSHSTGEIETADYLWSNKRLKNAALVTSRWLETVVINEADGYNRRWMPVDASDLDSGYNEPPTEPERSNILFWMLIRGQMTLIAQKEVAIIKTEPTKTSMIYKYREHYDVGDIITVNGQYSETAKMRISEYVEIEDETGQSGYPTLSAI